ncbi:hypothetical protein IAR55_001243 [Kwoniella newhampshirensis]|uniref:Uncharacterized protein n=1 Tax=Kwoniella newhampshirensis TaxID=1651941 RepID=A0AAW0Z5M3_9TREE
MTNLIKPLFHVLAFWAACGDARPTAQADNQDHLGVSTNRDHNHELPAAVLDLMGEEKVDASPDPVKLCFIDVYLDVESPAVNSLASEFDPEFVLLDEDDPLYYQAPSDDFLGTNIEDLTSIEDSDGRSRICFRSLYSRAGGSSSSSSSSSGSGGGARGGSSSSSGSSGSRSGTSNTGTGSGTNRGSSSSSSSSSDSDAGEDTPPAGGGSGGGSGGGGTAAGTGAGAAAGTRGSNANTNTGGGVATAATAPNGGTVVGGNGVTTRTTVANGRTTTQTTTSTGTVTGASASQTTRNRTSGAIPAVIGGSDGYSLRLLLTTALVVASMIGLGGGSLL